MLIIRKSQTNDVIATVSMNKTLANPYYLFSFQHIASKERVSFIPLVLSSNTRYDKFQFVESGTTNLNLSPPQVYFPYLGQYYYSIYEQVSSGNTNINNTYEKLESGRAIIIKDNDQEDDCLFEQYVSDNEINENIIFISEQEEDCIYPSPTPSASITPTITPTITITPSITPTNTKTPTQTATITPSQTCPITTQYLEVTLFDTTKFRLILWNDSGFTSAANANCDYVISGCAYGDLGTVYCGTEQINSGQHQHQFDLAPVLLPGEIVTGFTASNYTLNGCICPVNLILP